MKIAFGGHPPLSPVLVELAIPILCRATVNAPDLEEYFGQRVSVHDASDGRRIAAFLPALGAEDIWAIVKLANSYHRKRQAQLREPFSVKNPDTVIPLPRDRYTVN